ncbi:MAG: hypothetical protein VXV71_04755, partial [Candidatus Thermoplasmatota archaeon]|nr:hypothetical protein [Candidatus Thermoplasmatota archaeon]
MFAAILPCLDSEMPVATYGSIEVKRNISSEVSMLPNPWNILTNHSLILPLHVRLLPCLAPDLAGNQPRRTLVQLPSRLYPPFAGNYVNFGIEVLRLVPAQLLLPEGGPEVQTILVLGLAPGL